MATVEGDTEHDSAVPTETVPEAVAVEPSESLPVTVYVPAAETVTAAVVALFAFADQAKV